MPGFLRGRKRPGVRDLWLFLSFRSLERRPLLFIVFSVREAARASPGTRRDTVHGVAGGHGIRLGDGEGVRACSAVTCRAHHGV